jgi:hypothetical protein
MAGVAQEIWIDQLMEPFYKEASFLDFAQDMSQFVSYNTINLAEAGVDPVVLVNNDTYPVPTVQREDSPIAIPLDTFDTENTVVRNVEEMESSYDKMESVIKGHRRALRVQSLRRAAHAYAPQATGEWTPIVDATGDVRDDTSRKKLKRADLSRMMTKMRLLEGEGTFVAVLHPYHLEDLRNEDTTFNNKYVDYGGGTLVSKLEGFVIIEYGKTPTYTGGGVKRAYGSVPVPTTDCYSSFCFMQDEVMKADGSVEMFSEIKSAKERGDVVGFQKRFKALPIRNKYIGAWISKGA